MHIRVAKNIPVAAGLGGGSADAAAVLLALNQMHQEQPHSCPSWTPWVISWELMCLFFFYQRPALATGIGEKLCSVDGTPGLSSGAGQTTLKRLYTLGLSKFEVDKGGESH